MNTNETLIKQQWQDQEALHRFQLISPLLQTDLDDARRAQLEDIVKRKTGIAPENIVITPLSQSAEESGNKDAGISQIPDQEAEETSAGNAKSDDLVETDGIYD